MSDGYGSLCDDFYLDMYVNTELEVPVGRDTVLTFFERVQKQFPTMGNFYRGNNNDYCLEEKRDTGSYRWVNIEADRIGSGMVNPRRLGDAYEQHGQILELIPFMLSVSHLDIDSLDVTFGMDFDCAADHDEVISQALLSGSALGSVFDFAGAKAIDVSPAFVVAVDADCRTQARVSVESKTAVFDPLKMVREAAAEPISLNVTIRRYPAADERFEAAVSFVEQCRIGEELLAERVVPAIVTPLTNCITQRRLS